MIKVPLGKGATQTEFPLSPSEFTTKDSLTTAKTDRQFLQELVDQDRIITRNGSTGAIGEIVGFEVPNGSTYYHLAAKIIFNGAGTNTADLIGDPTVIETVGINGIGGGQIDFISPIFTVIGNNSRRIHIDLTADGGDTINASFTGYILNSPRP